MASFHDLWLAAVDRKNSVLCAGLDPAEFAMGRGSKGLPELVSKRDWALKYVENVAPFCAALKPNTQYWKGDFDRAYLREIVSLARELDMVVIEDAKLADIDDTNEAGVYATRSLGAHAVTIAPYAGNIAQAGQQGKKYEVGIIAMCLMSNAAYEEEKNQLIRTFDRSYDDKDVVSVDPVNGSRLVKKYMYLAKEAGMQGLEGIVIGAPSPKNHLKEEELAKARCYSRGDMLVLLPGVGHQGGEAQAIWKHFDPRNVIVNVGRAVMFPEDGNQAEAARHYQNMLNELRRAA